jgi:hypothetical protein
MKAHSSPNLLVNILLAPSSAAHSSAPMDTDSPTTVLFAGPGDLRRPARCAKAVTLEYLGCTPLAALSVWEYSALLRYAFSAKVRFRRVIA